MPTPSTLTRIRLDNIIICLNAAVTTVEVVSRELNTPFLGPIVTTMWSLLAVVQTIKKNKDVCVKMLEQIHQLLYAIIQIHMPSNTGGELTPKMLNNLGHFAETLHKIHSFVEAQQEKIAFKMFFRQGEMTTLLKGCTAGLDYAVDAFMVNGVDLIKDINTMKESAQQVHQQVVELIKALSDDSSSEGGSFIRSLTSSSSNSMGLLPSEPKIFHGRESELSAIVQSFTREVPRIAILGAGGMGKTSLSRAVLHHPELTSRYDQHRVFVSCDTVSTSIQLAALMGAHLGLKSVTDLTGPVIRHFSGGPPALLILDNLETIWEPAESRAAVEKLLSLLTDVEHLAVIITMRGAERPANVRWTRPFLEPLKPLGQCAARQTFIDITDDIHEMKDIDKVLLLADNMPLAIDLIAHLVDSEGITSVLSRWETQRTSIVSEGYDATSNLELSISLSISGPRIISSPHALDLLSLLSMLPDGLSDVELLQSQFSLENIRGCKSTLLRTSLAYTDGQKRLKALVPVREYVQKNHPPNNYLIHPLLKHYQDLLELYRKYAGTLSNAGVIARVTSNFANIQNVLRRCLSSAKPDIAEIVYSSLDLSAYSRVTGSGNLPLLDHIPQFLPQPTDHKLEAYLIIRLLDGRLHRTVQNATQLIHQALDHFKHFNDPDMQCMFYNTTAGYQRAQNDQVTARKFCQSGLSLAISIGSAKRQSLALLELAWIKFDSGHFLEAKEDASEAQRVAKITGNLYVEAGALNVEAICWKSFGSYNRCISLLDRATLLLDLCGLAGGEWHSLIRNAEADVHCCKSEYVEAHKIQTQILHDNSVDQVPFVHACALLNIAHIDIEIGGHELDVQQNLHTAVTLFQRLNHPAALHLCHSLEAALEVQQGNFLAARRLFQKCLQFSWGGEAEAVTYCLGKLASVQQWCATEHILFCWPVIFLVHSIKLKQRLELHKALQFLGDVFRAQGDQETAISLFAVALAGFTEMDVHRSRAECMVRLGDISKLNGDELKAAILWHTARPLFERSSQGKQLTDLDAKLASLSHNSSTKVQQETARTEHPQQLSGAKSPNSTVIEEMENMALEEKDSSVFLET
ncbi:hypothetical protein DFH09DRAFT_1039450 [Mycena vulgaris]|nr:hypothetical protein DFH09DRAFT_1039450 [Mycena vulgaris]